MIQDYLMTMNKKNTLTVDSQGNFTGTLPRVATYNLFVLDAHTGEGVMIPVKTSDDAKLFSDSLTPVGTIEGIVDQENNCTVLLFGTPFTTTWKILHSNCPVFLKGTMRFLRCCRKTVVPMIPLSRQYQYCRIR